MHRTRNAAYGQPYRGFESLPLRQPSLLRSFGWQAVDREGCPPEPRAKAGVRHRPCSLRRGVRRRLFPRPSNSKGMAHRAAHQSSVLPRPCCQERGRLSARHGGVFLSAPGRAFGQALGVSFGFLTPVPSSGGRAAKPNRPAELAAVSELLAGGFEGRRAVPGAARVREERSSPAAGAASCSIM
jgi:hypothetical protein